MPTAQNIDLTALFSIAMDTDAMREALGPNWQRVKDRTDIKVTTGRSRTYGSCLPWWAREARRLCLNRKGVRKGWLNEAAPAPKGSHAYRHHGERSEIKINATACGTPWGVIKTLLHEMCHLVPVHFTGTRVPWHGREFYTLLARLIEEVYPQTGAVRHYARKTWRMYAYDKFMREHMKGIDYVPVIAGARPVNRGLLPSGCVEGWLVLAETVAPHYFDLKVDGWVAECWTGNSVTIVR